MIGQGDAVIVAILSVTLFFLILLRVSGAYSLVVMLWDIALIYGWIVFRFK